MSELPKAYKDFLEMFPAVGDAYCKLGEELRKAGPLDARITALVKLGIAVGCGSEGAVHSHTRRALELGISHEEIRQTILLAITTIGFPRAMAALTWTNDILDAAGK